MLRRLTDFNAAQAESMRLLHAQALHSSHPLQVTSSSVHLRSDAAEAQPLHEAMTGMHGVCDVVNVMHRLLPRCPAA